MNENIFSYLEWEILREPLIIPNVYDMKELPEGKKEIAVNRNEQYKIQVSLRGEGYPDLFRKRRDVIPGSFAENFNIHGSDQTKSVQYILESCSIGSHHAEIKNEQAHYEADINIGGVRTKYKTEKEGVRLTEWYINGPQDSFVLSRSTNRDMQNTYIRKRSINDDDIFDSIEVTLKSGIYQGDFIRIKTEDFNFLITKVPKTIGPNWSINIGIEYQKEWGRIPDTDERLKICELCSFIFGRHLLLVGNTIYDKNGSLIEEYACNPWGRNPKSLCSEPDYPPIRIGDHASIGKAEKLVGQLLPAYYEFRKPLHLEEALWFYWISRAMPIGTNLPILAAAVENIMNGWFKYNKTKSHGVYMSKVDFEGLLHEEIEALKSKLESKPNGDRIINRLENAYNMGITDRFRVFFDEIDLSIDEKELKAIILRHAMAHGGMDFSKVDWRSLIENSNAYETLFHKILLKLLGYSGSYIDRSEIGWKDKKLD